MTRFVWSTAVAFAVAATGFADDPPKKADPPAADKKVEKKADDDHLKSDFSAHSPTKGLSINNRFGGRILRTGDSGAESQCNRLPA